MLLKFAIVTSIYWNKIVQTYKFLKMQFHLKKNCLKDVR